MNYRSSIAGGMFLLSLATLMSAAASTPEQIAAESAKANAFFDRVFNESVDRSPMTQGYLGIKKDTDKWDDFSEAHVAEDLALTALHLAELKRDISFDALDEQAKISYRLFAYSSERELEGWRWRYHNYTFTQMHGFHSDAPAFLINFHPVADAADAFAYIARLRALPKAFDELMANAKTSEARGVLPPRFVFPLLIEASREVVTGVPFDASANKSALWADIEGKINALKEVDDAGKDALLKAARSALVESVKPAYDQLIAMFEAHGKVATEEDGVWKLPDGAEYYSYKLRGSTTTNLTAVQIHELGLGEVARIHREMIAIKDKVGFKGDLAAFLKYTRDDPQFSYPTTPEGKAAYIKRATEMIDTMRARLPEFFTVFPKAPLVVKIVEPFREKGSASAFYEQPSADGTRPGAYYVNTLDMRALPIWEMETLAHHEAIPGHHMQIAIAQELENMPKFRKYGGNTAYSEGWALYAEFFPKEFGFYKDPYQDFGRLADELLRAARLVVDTGLHAKKWSRQQVVDYMVTNTPGSERDIFTESNRYVVWPGQATAYKVGQLKIIELRALAKKELGPKFDLRGYHDLVLKNGSLPMNLLEDNVRAWIAAKKM